MLRFPRTLRNWACVDQSRLVKQAQFLKILKNLRTQTPNKDDDDEKVDEHFNFILNKARPETLGVLSQSYTGKVAVWILTGSNSRIADSTSS